MTKQDVADVQHSDKAPDTYAAFCVDRSLYLANGTFTRQTLLARLPEIDPAAGPIRIYFHDPYICVSERFGLHAAVVDRRDGSVRQLQRKDYHCNVSSYSIGFLEHEGEALLIHQTEWNRLDITNLRTGELLAEREIYNKSVFGHYENEVFVPTVYNTKNYLDYFQSLIHVAPDGRHFLSNGWIWHPVGNILSFKTEAFFQSYELANLALDYVSDYNWDCPCAFIDNGTFVVAADRISEDFEGEEAFVGYEYKQLWFYNLSDRKDNKLVCRRKIACDCFNFNDDGEIWGEMYFDKQRDALIIFSEKGGFVLTLEGRVLTEYPYMALPDRRINGIFRDNYSIHHIWKYSPEHHIFYRFSVEQQKVITRA